MARADAFISVVCAVKNASHYLSSRLHALCDVLDGSFQYYEILLVDNASTDETIELANAILKERKNIHLCALSARVNDGIAIAAGVERTIGDFIITMDLELDPPNNIPQMIGLCVEGPEIVYGVPNDLLTAKTIYNRLSRLFWRSILSLNKVQGPTAMSTYRLFSRSVLNFMLSSRDFYRAFALAPALSGYRFATFQYDRAQSADAVKQRLGANVVFKALDLAFSTSVRPLRLVSIMSVVMCVFSIFYAGYVLIARIFIQNIAPGWATISLQVSLLFFFISIVLAVMCEYLLQILEATKRRTPFHISQETYSSVMEYKRDLNVRDQTPASFYQDN